MPIRFARALLLALLCSAWAAQAQTASDPAVLYHNYCSVCHGDRGDGKSRATGALSTVPRDFTSAASKQELTRERIALAIAHGRPGTAMIGCLADHVLSRFVQGQAAPAGAPISGKRAHGGREADVAQLRGREADAAAATASTSVPIDMMAGLPNGLKGDAKRGGAFYLANCATCHGARGDGAGPRAYFINPKPRNFIDTASRQRFNRVALYAGISEGRLASEMPAWKQVATPQQIADVSEYVFQNFIRNEPVKAAAQAPK